MLPWEHMKSSTHNFKDKVIRIVKKIPKGRVTTYGTVATLAGLPRGARLVGGILQKTLLEQEGVEVAKDFMIDLQKYGWFGK